MNEHLGGSYPQGDANTVCEDVWGYILVKYNIKSMVDIGCGFGHAAKWFNDFLVACVGVDGWDEAIQKNLLPHVAVKHDFTTGLFPHTKPFDLAWSAEFLEHLEERFLPNVMPLFAACKIAVITHAEPGQPGHHHVNCQTDEYWIGKFAEYGMFMDFEETNILRATDRWSAGYGRRTLMLFESEKGNIDWCQNPIEWEVHP